jgi:hypothetical protein
MNYSLLEPLTLLSRSSLIIYASLYIWSGPSSAGIGQGEGTALPGATKNETVIALKITSVSQQYMQTFQRLGCDQVHRSPPRSEKMVPLKINQNALHLIQPRRSIL